MKQAFKNLASIMLVSMVVLIGGTTVQAQQHRGQQGPPPAMTDEQIDDMVADLSKTLSLTDEQETQVSEKYTAHFDQVKDLMKSGRPDRKVMEAMNTDFEADVKSLLTDDQKALYETYLKKQKKNRPQRR